MIFYYSAKRLLNRFLTRFSASLIFVLFALWLGGEFWYAVAFFWLEAIIEVYVMYHYGYFEINQNKIKTRTLLFQKEMSLDQINEFFIYNDEWTFKIKREEIRIDKNFIKESQRAEFEKMIREFRQSQSSNIH